MWKTQSKRSNIKTTKEEIADYWVRREAESGLSVDWIDAKEVCWRCGYDKNLQRCHIIPDSLGGKDEPSNFVLLCERCHIDAPNVESKTFMWDWIRANGTPLYNTFWELQARNEYEFIYKKSYIQELIDRDILSHRDRALFFSIPIGRSVNHFAHPWKNTSTNAGLLRMRLVAYDKLHPNIKPKSAQFRAKEYKFDMLISKVCNIAKQFNWNVWEGRSQNPFSFTVSAFVARDKKMAISIKFAKGNKFVACFTDEVNPNRLKTSDYSIELGESDDAVVEFVLREVQAFSDMYGLPPEQRFVFTINSEYRLRGSE